MTFRIRLNLRDNSDRQFLGSSFISFGLDLSHSYIVSQKQPFCDMNAQSLKDVADGGDSC